MGDNDTKSLLFVKKSDAKKGSLWNKLTNTRIIKQHGGYDIPEGDLHAVRKFDSPNYHPQPSPEETKAAMSDIEKQIERLKQKDSPPSEKAPNVSNVEELEKYIEEYDD